MNEIVTDTGKTDCEVILNSIFPFAKKCLREFGEFFPFGGVMKTDGKVVCAAAYSGDGENPPSKDLIDLLVDAFRNETAKGENRATAIVYDGRVTPPGKADKTDAVVVQLEHVEGYGVTVFFPYTSGTGGPAFGQTFATRDRRGIFNNDL